MRQIGPRQIGPRQIGPRQIGPRKIFVPANWAPENVLAANWAPKMFLAANWAPANWAPADWAPEFFCVANWAPANWAPGKCWCGKLGPCKIGYQNYIPNCLMHKYSYTNTLIHKYSIYLLAVYIQYKYIHWGKYVSRIHILVLDIFCQQLGDICQLEGVCAPFRCRVAECAFF